MCSQPVRKCKECQSLQRFSNTGIRQYSHGKSQGTNLEAGSLTRSENPHTWTRAEVVTRSAEQMAAVYLDLKGYGWWKMVNISSTHIRVQESGPQSLLMSLLYTALCHFMEWMCSGKHAGWFCLCVNTMRMDTEDYVTRQYSFLGLLWCIWSNLDWNIFMLTVN